MTMTLTRLLPFCLGLALLTACLPAARDPQPGAASAITGPAVTTTTLPAPAASTPPKRQAVAPYGSGPLVPMAPRPLSMPMPAAPKVMAKPMPQPAPAPAVKPAATAPAPEVAPAKAPAAKPATPETAPPEAPQPPAVVLDDPQALKCQKQGGQWANVGQAGLHACILPTKDGGKQCKAKTDCQGECLARSGTCSPIAPLFGCNDILTEGGLRVTQCID
jgi:hypothetical protein